MLRSEQNYISVSGFMQRHLKQGLEFHRLEMPEFTISEGVVD
ncbi:hypothetical protein BTN49_1387 [Candidatus Enterovibrio escicola]|uniref:Uncharacterized protein n=1 Tax=Candidatus Enterovibrio escicola TaxID=1927127 RepID=A0A2A5T3V6_9GAMM|nr:hypothetical protein [Candidatus Enterovibrio escacola]PCS22836.1 hypothetical protein BTN49_1387 [Candidatus Enterovibrio escacola]